MDLGKCFRVLCFANLLEVHDTRQTALAKKKKCEGKTGWYESSRLFTYILKLPFHIGEVKFWFYELAHIDFTIYLHLMCHRLHLTAWRDNAKPRNENPYSGIVWLAVWARKVGRPTGTPKNNWALFQSSQVTQGGAWKHSISGEELNMVSWI